MPFLFKKHYTREEARALLPQVKQWLQELILLRDRVQTYDTQIAKQLGLGDDLGGELINNYVRSVASLKEVLGEFHTREIQVKDLDRGIIDFPAFVGGKEVFLCWQSGEGDVEFWHDLDAGYAGREPL